MLWDSLDFTTGKFLMCHKKPCPLMSVDASPPLVNSENNKFPVVNLCVKSLDLPIGTGAVNIDPRSPNAQFRPFSTLRQSILVNPHVLAPSVLLVKSPFSTPHSDGEARIAGRDAESGTSPGRRVEE